MDEIGIGARWRFVDESATIEPAAPARAVAALEADPADEACSLSGLHPLVATLLAHRGITDGEAAERFLSPKLSQMHDPALLPGAPQAADRIVQALRDRQRIVIYGDYDVDGITASSILWHTLSALGGRVSTYVPHRIEEGYGLNEEAMLALCEGPTAEQPLIVSVDCGITARGPAAIARDAGVDLIITDHHEFDPADLPLAHTLVHPRLALPGQAPYPFDGLCGAGVAFKLAWLVARTWSGTDRLAPPLRRLLLDLLSLAALGTVADVVPLVDENRVITAYGLGQIKRTGMEGLNALIDAANLRGEKISAYHVGFVLGPRLNACGRMGHAKVAVELLTTAAAERAHEIAAFLTQENERRRAAERAIFEEARALVTASGFDQDDQRAIVLGKEGWHQGVVGIVASRLVEAFCRPVILLNVSGGTAHGSARSVEGVSVHEALQHCAEHLLSFGGHAMAAGLRMDSGQLEAFRRAFVAFVNQRLQPADLTAVMEVEACCTLADLTLDVVRQIEQLAPFGRGNPAPLLCLREVTLDRPAERIGGEGRHLRLWLRQHGRVISAVAFGMGDLAERLPAGAPLDVVFEPKLSWWQGRARVEVHVKDLKPRTTEGSLL